MKKEKKMPWWSKLILWILLFIFLWFVLFNLFSPPVSDEERNVRGALNGPDKPIEKSFSTIIVPIKIQIISEDSGIYGSKRDEENIISLIGKANKIWEQGGIHFQIEEIVVTETSSAAIPNALRGNYIELTSHENFGGNVINVFLSKNLEGINGLAVASIRSTFVADRTTVNDFRATAHEFGHILGLGHVEPVNRLMAQGQNGELLTTEEILFARRIAEKF